MTYIAMFRTLVRVIRTINHLVANERCRYASWTIVTFPMAFLADIDCSLAHDTHSFFRLTIVNSPSQKENINNLDG